LNKIWVLCRIAPVFWSASIPLYPAPDAATQVLDASGEAMQKAFEQGAQLKRLQEERKAAGVGRWRSGGARRGRGSRGTRGRRGGGRGRKRRRSSGLSSSDDEDGVGGGDGDMEGSDFEVFMDGDDDPPQARTLSSDNLPAHSACTSLLLS